MTVLSILLRKVHFSHSLSYLELLLPLTFLYTIFLLQTTSEDRASKRNPGNSQFYHVSTSRSTVQHSFSLNHQFSRIEAFSQSQIQRLTPEKEISISKKLRHSRVEIAREWCKVHNRTILSAISRQWRHSPIDSLRRFSEFSCPSLFPERLSSRASRWNLPHLCPPTPLVDANNATNNGQVSLERCARRCIRVTMRTHVTARHDSARSEPVHCSQKFL